MLRRLQARIALLAAVLTGAVLAGALLFAYGVARQQYVAGRVSAFESAVNQLQYQWDRYDQLDGDWLARLEAQNDMKLLLTENGRPLLHTLQLRQEDRAVLNEAVRIAEEQHGLSSDAPPLAGSQSVRFTFSAQDAAWRAELRLDGNTSDHWTSLLAVQSLAPETARARQLAGLFVLAGVAGWIGLGLVCWFVAGRAVRPVGRAMEEQQQFLSAAGHELRTPLAVIRASAAAAAGKPEQTGRYLEVIDGESRRMGALVDDLLLLSAGASARARLRRESLEPDTFLLDFAESMELLARKRGRGLRVALPSRALPAASADAFRLRQLLTILVDNALRFAPAGSDVELRLSEKGGRVRFAVVDRGPGVPDADKKRIFGRFVCGVPAEDDTRHYGLGLAVAAELTIFHGGRLWVQDTPGGGATFCLELPRTDDPGDMKSGRGLDKKSPR